MCVCVRVCVCARAHMRTQSYLPVTPWTVAPSSSLLCPWNCPGKNTGVAISYSRGSSQSRDWTHVSRVSRLGRQILYHYATGEPLSRGEMPVFQTAWIRFLLNEAVLRVHIYVCKQKKIGYFFYKGLQTPSAEGSMLIMLPCATHSRSVKKINGLNWAVINVTLD